MDVTGPCNQVTRLAPVTQIINFLYFWYHSTWLIHWSWDKMAGIFQTTFSDAFFFNEIVWILIKIALMFVPKGPINNIPALVQKMAWRRPGDKPLSEPMMVNLLMHICITRLQGGNTFFGAKLGQYHICWWPDHRHHKVSNCYDIQYVK